MGLLRAHRPRRGHHDLARSACAAFTLALAGSLLATLSLATPADAQARQFHGVSTQAPDTAGALVPDDYNRMRFGGVGTLRFPVSWQRVERSPGDYRWGETDAIVGNAAARGIRALPFVFAPPDYVGSPPTQPADRRAFRRLMAAMASRYGRGGDYWRGPYQAAFGAGAKPRPVRTWQLFNEQNGPGFWGGRPSPRAYGRLVKMGAHGIRSQQRRAEIVLGGMFATPSGPGGIISWRFLKRLYRVKGIKRAFDTVAVHPYAPNLRGVRIQTRRIRKVMRRNNDRAARIRVTELGWGSRRTDHRLTKTPKGQARLLRRSFRLFARQRRRWNVRGMNWFSWQDGGGCPFCESTGLFSGPPNDRTPKRSWRAFRRVAR